MPLEVLPTIVPAIVFAIEGVLGLYNVIRRGVPIGTAGERLSMTVFMLGLMMWFWMMNAVWIHTSIYFRWAAAGLLMFAIIINLGIVVWILIYREGRIKAKIWAFFGLGLIISALWACLPPTTPNISITLPLTSAPKYCLRKRGAVFRSWRLPGRGG